MSSKHQFFCHKLVFTPQIDFVAHDDIPYSSAGSEDIYKHIKEAGENTNSVSLQKFKSMKQSSSHYDGL